MSMYVRIDVELDENTWNRDTDGEILTKIGDDPLAFLEEAQISVIRDGKITTSTVIEEIEAPTLILDETW